MNSKIVLTLTFLIMQKFHLHVRESGVMGRPVTNLTHGRPSFLVTGLRPDTGYVVSVTSSNAKGASEARMVQAFTLKSDGLRQLIETSESALSTNNVKSASTPGELVDSVWFMGECNHHQHHHRESLSILRIPNS